MKILVADDSGTTRKVIVGLLFSLGFSDVHQAENGSQALNKLKSAHNFDLLITDWNMPEMNGLELVTNVRSTPELKDIRILMVTAEATRDAVITAAKAGINGYIMKPFSAATLKEKITKIVPAPIIAKKETTSSTSKLNEDLLRIIK
ncbi:response regulator [Methylomonas methanica]|uniref:Response regulator receiver protein n=1 Tax=Methylomonas methanica (strain DSM 25384 / MC09) TaxID=857087 RepID=G0A7R5_METMM|nr:response regulator receiver protein [Methylomonas methanica MC09]